MQLVRKARLYLRKEQTDKVYEVDLCRFSRDRYVVKFRYGRRGGRLRDGTKTLTPVDFKKAEALFDSIVVARKNEGYLESGDASPGITALPPIKPVASGSIDTTSRIEAAVLKRLREAAAGTDPKKLRRVAWRIGERGLKKAVPDLVHLIPARDDLLNYCVAWSLGRLADPRAHPALLRLMAATRHPAVKRITLEALLATTPGADPAAQARDLLDETIKRLPAAVRDALIAEDAGGLASAAASQIFRGGPEAMALCEALYRVSAAMPVARAFILPECPSHGHSSCLF